MIMSRIPHAATMPALVLVGATLGGCVAIEPVASPPAKVVICHKGKQSLELPETAARAHLDHGDTMGPCR